MDENPFIDKNKKPSTRAVYKTMGRYKDFWKKLNDFIVKKYDIKGEFKLMGKSWVFWYRKSNKTLFTLHPRNNGLVAQIVLGRKEVEQANNEKFGKNVAEVYKKAKQYHDGKWLFINVKTEKDLKDIRNLLTIKKKPKK
jgi:hypothetical protein